MSHLGRVIRKQRRIINRLKNAPITSFHGFGLSDILVFDCYYWNWHNVCHDSQHLQAEINEGKYKDIKAFDSYHTTDIEFSHFYSGKYEGRYQSKTKNQLLGLGVFWRERINQEFPESNVLIVVYFDTPNKCWFLDTYNWNIIAEWEEIQGEKYWL